MKWETNKYFALLSEGKPDDAEDVRQTTIPNKLIKFIWLDDNDIENAKRFATLKNDEIWFANIKALNDPYEFHGIVVDVEKFKSAGYPDEIVASYKSMINFDDWGVTCFSANQVSFLPMWAYYANNHQGFCIEYEVINKNCIYEVLYENAKIKAAGLICDAIEEAKQCMKNQKTVTPKMKAYMRIFMHNMFTKHESWKHEAEYRIVEPLDGKEGKNIPVRNLGLKTTRIIAGYKCSEKNIEILNSISNELGIGSVYRSFLQEGEYSVRIEQ